MTVFTDETADARKAKKEHRKELDFAAEERRRAVNSLFETQEGRTYLWFLLENAGFVAFLSSNQVISDLIRINPEAFADLIKEKFDERNTRSNLRSDSDDAGSDTAGEGINFASLDDPANTYD